MKLDELLDTTELARLIDGHYVRERFHTTLPLRILNYTEKTQYERAWTPETEMCRGLIVDDSRTIVSRPFRKFFNLGERPDQAVPSEPFTAYEKLDGSLGIAYLDEDGLPSLATRGSFISDQAIRGTVVLRTKYAEHMDMLAHLIEDAGLTFCFEIILPENRIVVDYGKREDVVLLAVFHTKTGDEISPSTVWHDCPFSLPKTWTYASADDLLTVTDSVEGPDFDNAEGVVVRFFSGLRLKIKRSEYVRLHRIVTGIRPRRIWEMLKEGSPPIGRLYAGTPPGFQTWARGIVDGLEGEYRAIEAESLAEYGRITALAPEDRKAFAIEAAQHAHAPVLFKLYDGKPYEEIIWKRIKPSPADPYHVEV